MRISVAGEYVAGHVTFLDALHQFALERTDLTINMLRLPFAPERGWERLPPITSNWSVRASLRTRRRLGRAWRDQDALLIHTQTAALFSVGLMRRVPTVISTDATPIGYDRVGGPHGHFRGPYAAELIKRRVVKRAFRHAAAIAAWSDWTRASLIEDYGVDPRRIHLIPGGVEIPPARSRKVNASPVRLLFVARNFEAKGGYDLLAALDGLEGWALDVVTHSPLPPRPGVRVHHGLTPKSPGLAELYSMADATVLPTRSDASPFAILEGMAAGLPVVTTSVGAISEIVVDETGLLVTPGDVRALRQALAQILSDGDLRKRLGDAGRVRVVERFNARHNANRLLDLLIAVGQDPALGMTGPKVVDRGARPPDRPLSSPVASPRTSRVVAR
jgi:glycosyltransferase involved in cell wall biosynthesis